MTTIYDMAVREYIEKLALELQKTKGISAPDWSKFVKTGVSKERAPINSDWWFERTASILRQVYLKGPIGVNKLRNKYGSKKNRGHAPDKFFKASGKIIRTALQQLQLEGLIETQDKTVHRGRIMTNKGKSFMDKIASSSKKTKAKNGDNKNTKQEVKVSKEKPAN